MSLKIEPKIPTCFGQRSRISVLLDQPLPEQIQENYLFREKSILKR